jgi:hypothetical protein
MKKPLDDPMRGRRRAHQVYQAALLVLSAVFVESLWKPLCFLNPKMRACLLQRK